MSDTAFSALDCTDRIASNQEADRDHYTQEKYQPVTAMLTATEGVLFLLDL
jgi:hypothetical protein